MGGSAGGTEGKLVYGLDEFEFQAVHYNMACAHSKLGNTEAVSTVRPKLGTYHSYTILLFQKQHPI